VVKEPVVLVVHDEENGLRPDFRVGHQRLQGQRGEKLTPGGGRGRVLVVAVLADDPTDRWKGPTGDVRNEVMRKDREERLLVQGRGGALVLTEVGQDRIADLHADKTVISRRPTRCREHFHETPASSSASGIVGQSTLQRASGELFVMSTGPPCSPEGSMLADSDMSRFGWVGPITEQW
jgi:hypothetical protein